ncbi:MAG: type II toxin-antitoxin system Phd/YefM family antitoxin [Myxococcota bacterium]|jgi:prevent-host-death family protein
MTSRISTLDVRQGLGDILNKVVLRHDEFVIERKGKPLAALIPMDKLDSLNKVARRHALEFLDQQMGGTALSDDEAMKVAVDAQHKSRTSNKASDKS